MVGRKLVVAAALAVGLTAGPAQARPSDAAIAADKDFCVGIKTAPWKPYDGPCDYGAPLGPMQFFATVAPRQTIQQQLRRSPLPQSNQDKLFKELDRIGGMPRRDGRERVKRRAKRAQRSWLSRATGSCLVFGAAASGITFLIELAFEQRFGGKNALKAGAAACVSAVAAPKLNRLLKRRGFNLKA